MTLSTCTPGRYYSESMDVGIVQTGSHSTTANIVYKKVHKGYLHARMSHSALLLDPSETYRRIV